VRSNFFYTRTVPCELWFLNRDKPDEHRDKVLMIDARNTYRKITRKIYDFSPEQQQNLLAIVWLYRGDTERFLDLASRYLWEVANRGSACFKQVSDDGETLRPLPDFMEAVTALREELSSLLNTRPGTDRTPEGFADLEKEQKRLAGNAARFQARVDQAPEEWVLGTPDTSACLNRLVERFAPLAETSRDLAGEADQLYKIASRLIETCEQEYEARSSTKQGWNGRDLTRARRAADEARRVAVEQLDRVRYFHRQSRWLTERFPDGELRDVEGLVKLVDRAEIEANDWSLTPGRYVGVAPEEEDEDFDFKEALREIHVELEDLNAEAVVLAERIRRNFRELGV